MFYSAAVATLGHVAFVHRSQLFLSKFGEDKAGVAKMALENRVCHGKGVRNGRTPMNSYG